MKHFLLILLLLYFRPCITISQVKYTGSITGIVTNSARQPLENANIILLRSQDTAHVTTTTTNKNGHFIFGQVPEGSYHLAIRYLGYQPFTRQVNVTSFQAIVNMDTLLLAQTGLTLQAVEIKERRRPITLKKDTIEYNADAFKTRDNAVLEELLRKLPGLIVDKDGTIHAQGDAVRKILVDGKPFFGNDTKQATGTLAADMIDRIQLVDRARDAAEGGSMQPDDREKVINIVLKDDKKERYLGRIGAGYGTDTHFGVNANLNRFANKQQLSILANGDNINHINLLESGVPNGMPMGGINNSWNGGINFNQTFSSKLNLHASYLLNSGHTENQRNSNRQNLLADSTYTYLQQSSAQVKQFIHAVDLRLEYEADSSQKISFATVLKQAHNRNLLSNTYTSLGGKGQLVNNGQSFNDNHSEAPNYSTVIFYQKKFKKPGRSFHISLSGYYSTKQETDINWSASYFIPTEEPPYGDTLNQHTNRNMENSGAFLLFTYIEPVLKDRLLELAYIGNLIQTTNEKLTYDYNYEKEAYSRLNDSLSNFFTTSAVRHSATIRLRTEKKRYDYSLGMNLQTISLRNENQDNRQMLQQHDTRLFPFASFNYQFSRNRRLRFMYMGSLQQLPVELLQPVPDNSNPLYITLGNPDLEMPFSHTFQLSYNSVQARTGRTFGINLNGVLMRNKIVKASWLDSLGRQVTQPVNSSGAYNISVNVDNSFPLPGLSTFISVPTAITYARDITVINNIKSYNKNLTITQSLNFNYTYKELFDISTAARVYYNNTWYGLQQYSNYQYCNYTLSFNGALHLPWGIMTGGSIDVLWNTGQAAGYNQDAKIINAFLSKSLFHHKQAVVKLQGFDLLGQNVSISRTVGESYVEDVQSNVLTRFFMLSFTYFLK